MAGHTEGPWAFWDECGATPDNSCTPWSGANELAQEIYDTEGNHIGKIVLSVCERVQEESKACTSCTESNCAGLIKVSKEDALVISASPDIYDSLAALEWAGTAETCLVCGVSKGISHRPDCHIGSSLAKARGFK